MVLPVSSVQTLGKPAFRTDHTVEFLGATWTRTVAFAGYNVQYQADIPVSEMSIDLQNEFPERRDYLMQLLEVEPTVRTTLFVAALLREGTALLFRSPQTL